MTRPASTAKAGFFPTPERVTEMITRFVIPSPQKGRLLDPCCGEGIAPQCVAQAWNLEAYGFEIDANRGLATVPLGVPRPPANLDPPTDAVDSKTYTGENPRFRRWL
jgi:hypothetical protein